MDRDHATVSPLDENRPAPWLPIPSRAISAVEHPCIVKNIDKGITSLGGPVKLSKGLREKLEPQRNAEGKKELPKLISVSLRPDDPFAKRLLSTPVNTKNLLLRVTVPKRTGRKRKRGSSAPYLSEDGADQPVDEKKNERVDAATIFRSLQDNASKYTVSLCGLIDETHRFRNLPDLQYAASTNSTMTGLRDNVLPLNYSLLKKFEFDTTPGVNLTKSIGPSAEFIQMAPAFNYRYQQNGHVKYAKDRAEASLQRGVAYSGYTIITPTAESVPTGPKAGLPPETSLAPHLQTLIANIRAELERRPIITRHILFNKLGWDKRDLLRQTAIYCGYFFETGPWREALIKWGVDPRTNSVYRHFQTVSYTSYRKPGDPRHRSVYGKHLQGLIHLPTRELETQHTFDGVSVSHTGNLFQFCDITDPLIRRILDTNDIRTTCAPTSQGWYHVGTWAKVTVILKDKMNTILSGGTPDNSVYERILSWPEYWDDGELYATYRAEVWDKEVHLVKQKEHAIMHSVRWAARNPRYAFEKMEAAGTGDPNRVEPEDPAAEEVELPEDMTEIPDTAHNILNEGDEEDEEDVDEDEDDDDDEDDEDEDEDDAEDPEEEGLDEDIDGVWDADEDSVTFAPAADNDTGLLRPFGGLYRV